MKKFLISIAAIAAVAILLSSCSGEKYEEEKAGQQLSIRYLEVNLREEPSTDSDIIEKLYQEDTVILTGNSYEYPSLENLPTDHWHQVTTLKGTTGWIVTESIEWLP